MAWHIFEKLLEGVANYSPFIGKVWITFLFMFRLIMVASIGDTVYGDEQSSFKCNTLQPGCENVCYNHFAPISQIRFWAVQILFVGTPSIMFIIYAMHRMTTIPPSHAKSSSDGADDESEKPKKIETASSSTSSSKAGLPGYDEIMHNGSRVGKGKNGKLLKKVEEATINQKWNKFDGSRSEVIYVNRPQTKETQRKSPAKKSHQAKRKAVYQQDGKTEIVKTPGIVRAYVVQAFLRTAIEAVFLYLQYDMYKFDVPELYVCNGFPCPRTVECFVSRPMEKTLFLRFMYAMTIVSLLLNLIEIYQLISKWVRRSCCRSGNSNAVSLDDRLPMEEVVIQREDGAIFRRARMQNTFPDLGPIPRSYDNSLGESSGDESMDSDYRFYGR
uniref:gap junction alpha-5 protein isoform X2 n=1 Tax=Ciona intestinalis TaxID=7719 RepID=UPI000EF464EB|nr:gap junction alpha-5 protein isoform X2 [Ciona intestinalis]|eukprot:XP_026692599.1 gap junction alpha-5 protein isoform X2 [Ciona intestinalis]